MLFSALIKKGWNKICLWREIAHERSELRRLSEFIAKDIGISRAEVEREADRPFWDSDRATNRALLSGGKAATSPQDRCLHAR